MSKGQAVQLSFHLLKTENTFFLFNKLSSPSTESVVHPYTPENSVNLFTKSVEYSHIWESFFWCEEQKQMGHETSTI